MSNADVINIILNAKGFYYRWFIQALEMWITLAIAVHTYWIQNATMVFYDVHEMPGGEVGFHVTLSSKGLRDLLISQ